MKRLGGALSVLLVFSVSCSGKDEADGDGEKSDAGDGDGDGDLPGGDGDGDLPGGDGDGDLPGGDGDGDGDGDSACSLDLCGTECVDLMTTDAFCGDCTTACDSFHSCQLGACVRVACEGTLTLCDEECFDTTSDVEHCGSCTGACDPTFLCAESSCTCSEERTECDGYCAHPDFDRQHCGGCADALGEVCDSDEACLSGVCGTIAIPEEPYCDVTEGWDPSFTAFEFQILDLVNRRRAEGADCGDGGYFAPTHPLQMEASLRCAARAHSKDMVDRDFFAHTNPDNDGPGPRLDDAGYEGFGWGENIAAGSATAEGTMNQWMNSDGHCANLMNPDFSLIGVGYYPGGQDQYQAYWTQTFGN